LVFNFVKESVNFVRIGNVCFKTNCRHSFGLKIGNCLGERVAIDIVDHDCASQVSKNFSDAAANLLVASQNPLEFTPLLVCSQVNSSIVNLNGK